MAWKNVVRFPSNTERTGRTTKHTCGGPVFGKKTPGCPRCDELLAGAPPVEWRSSQRDFDRRRDAIERANPHNCTKSGCGPICTYGDW